MLDIKNAPFVTKMREICDLMYDKGWDERNGGNISYLLETEEVENYIEINKTDCTYQLQSSIPELAGKIFIVTGTGKYFKNVKKYPEINLGIIRVSEDGCAYHVLWGYEDGGKPTSELSSHLLSHKIRLAIDPMHRVIMHTHATNLVAMTFVVPLCDRDITRILWQMCTECLVVFPDGVGILPWMICGGDEIGLATAQKMNDYRLVIWGQHGIFGAGRDIDETFGLIETAEKAAEIYLKIAHLPILQTITDDNLTILAKAFGVSPKDEFIK